MLRTSTSYFCRASLLVFPPRIREVLPVENYYTVLCRAMKHSRSQRPLASIFCLLFSLLTCCPVAGFESPNSGRQWESAVESFERDDALRSYPANAILFVGSSSIRLWESLADDMAPYPVIQRGFGGAKMVDVLTYKDRILEAHTPPAIVLFVANDITGNSKTDLSPDRAAGQFFAFADYVLRQKPETELFIVEITPTASRLDVWPQTMELNNHLSKLCESLDRVTFIPTRHLFLAADGKPLRELFRSDQLHLSPLGYRVWTKQIRAFLDPVMQK